MRAITFCGHTAASLAISAGANVKAVQTMLGHKSAALTLDTYADLFPDDLEAVADALDEAAQTMNLLWTHCGRTPVLKPETTTPRPSFCWSGRCFHCRGGGIRTHDLFVPNEARYQAAPHPA